MALQGPFAVIADNPAPDVVDALRAGGASPIVEAGFADAPSALASVEPEAIVLAEPWPAQVDAAAFAGIIEQRRADGLYMPVMARIRDDGMPPFADALALSLHAPPARLVRRLTAALRVRTLHGTVLRRTRMLASHGEAVPELPRRDPLDDASVIVAGRGRSYPVLSVAVGERVGVIGALSVESVARALNVRDIDGLIVADGFGPRVVEGLLTVLAEDVRFRDLPVVVLGGPPNAIEPFAMELANLERVADGPQRAVERLIPYVRLHAFGERLKRMLKSLEAKGMIDPDTGLLAHDAFWRDLNRAVDDAERRGTGLTVARFCFEGGDRRMSLDAARLLGRLMRQVDFACREADSSIFAVFTETDLRAAHVVARRLAAVLKNTMFAADRKGSGVDTAVTLATLKSTDNVQSLIARVVGEAAG